MKKFFIYVSISLLVLIGSLYIYYSTRYDGWKTIYIENCGTYEEDGYMYITDQDSNPIMIQSYSFAGYSKDDVGDVESNKFFDRIMNITTINGTLLSNSANYGKTLIIKEGKKVKIII